MPNSCICAALARLRRLECGAAPHVLTAAGCAAAPQVAEAEGWTVAQTIDALIRKAGCDAFPTLALRDSLQITLYQVQLLWPFELPVCWVSPLVRQHVRAACVSLLVREHVPDCWQTAFGCSATVYERHPATACSVLQSTAHSLTYEEYIAAAALAEGHPPEAAEQLQPGSPLVGAVPA